MQRRRRRRRKKKIKLLVLESFKSLGWNLWWWLYASMRALKLLSFILKMDELEGLNIISQQSCLKKSYKVKIRS